MDTLEQASEQGYIDLFYGDETQVSQTGFVPYGWQFDDEQVAIAVQKGKAINCFGLFARSNQFYYWLNRANINAQFIIDILDEFSWQIKKTTVIVLDNARIHTARKLKQLLEIWQQRGLYVFYLPPYSPHLNIVERLWKEIKEGWIKPSDYNSADDLFYAFDRICANVGKTVKLHFRQKKIDYELI